MERTVKDDRLDSTEYACNSSPWEVKASLDYMNFYLKRAEGSGRGVTVEEISAPRKECRHSKDESVGKERTFLSSFSLSLAFVLVVLRNGSSHMGGKCRGPECHPAPPNPHLCLDVTVLSRRTGLPSAIYEWTERFLL